MKVRFTKDNIIQADDTKIRLYQTALNSEVQWKGYKFKVEPKTVFWIIVPSEIAEKIESNPIKGTIEINIDGDNFEINGKLLIKGDKNVYQLVGNFSKSDRPEKQVIKLPVEVKHLYFDYRRGQWTDSLKDYRDSLKQSVQESRPLVVNLMGNPSNNHVVRIDDKYYQWRKPLTKRKYIPYRKESGIASDT